MGEWLRDDRMVYKLTPDGINEFEIAVSSANRRLDRAGLIAIAEQIRCLPDLLKERDSLAQRVSGLETLLGEAHEIACGYRDLIVSDYEGRNGIIGQMKNTFDRVVTFQEKLDRALAGSEEGK